MKQTRQRKSEILRELQAVQGWALDHSIHSFQIDATVYPLEDEGEGPEGLIREYGDTEERFLYVTIFLKGDDSDGDYLRITIGPDDSEPVVFRAINNIKSFIGYV